MNVTTGVTKIDALCDRLDGLTERVPVETIKEWMLEIDVQLDDVMPWVRFDPDRYLRNLIREGEHYHMLALCWRSGQRSPIHNHAQSTCGLKVLQGVCTETIFEHTPAGYIKAVSSSDVHEGCVCASQDDDTHQVSNLQPAGEDLVTLHVYSPPLLNMKTFSLTDNHVADFRPMVLEHLHGSGI